jgi:nucleoside-diphosphate-sugar epimerase
MSTPRRALVIGGLGFIGINLTERLLTQGHHVTVVTPSRARHARRAARWKTRAHASSKAICVTAWR